MAESLRQRDRSVTMNHVAQHGAQQEVRRPVSTSRPPWAALVLTMTRASGNRCGCASKRQARGCLALRRGAPRWRRSIAAISTSFSDVWLGADAGLTLLPEILSRQPDLGVIVVTAFASIESAVDAIKRGAVDYVPSHSRPIRSGSRPIAWSKRSACGGSWSSSARSSMRAASRRSSNLESSVPSMLADDDTRGCLERRPSLARRKRHWQEHRGTVDSCT